MSLSKDNLCIMIENCLERIRLAKDYLHLHRILNECQQEWLLEMNKSPAFFQIIMRGLQHSYIMETFKLYDSNKDSLSIEKLLDICQSNSKYFRTEHIDIHQSVDDNWPDEYITTKINTLDDIANAKVELLNFATKINNLTIRRNKFYAHSDKRYVSNLKSLENNAPFTYGDLDDLLMFANKICNTLLFNLNGRRYLTQSSNIEDVKNLFHS